MKLKNVHTVLSLLIAHSISPSMEAHAMALQQRLENGEKIVCVNTFVRELIKEYPNRGWMFGMILTATDNANFK